MKSDFSSPPQHPHVLAEGSTFRSTAQPVSPSHPALLGEWKGDFRSRGTTTPRPAIQPTKFFDPAPRDAVKAATAQTIVPIEDPEFDIEVEPEATAPKDPLLTPTSILNAKPVEWISGRAHSAMTARNLEIAQATLARLEGQITPGKSELSTLAHRTTRSAGSTS